MAVLLITRNTFNTLHLSHFIKCSQSLKFGVRLDATKGFSTRANIVDSVRSCHPIQNSNTLCRRNTLTLNYVNRTVTTMSGGKQPKFDYGAVKWDVASDTLIYTYDKGDKYFNRMVLFGLLALVTTPYFVFNLNTSLKQVPAGEKGIYEGHWYSGLSNPGFIARAVISALILVTGIAATFICFAFPNRTVRSLVLKTGGDKVAVTVYRGFSRYKTFDVPVNHISAVLARSSGKSAIPVKIKGRMGYFLLDSDGTYHKKALFDYHVGMAR